MATLQKTSQLRYSPPPPRSYTTQPTIEPSETLETAHRPKSDKELKRALLAMATLATTLGPQAAQAATEQSLEQEVEQEDFNLFESAGEKVDAVVDTVSEKAKPIGKFFSAVGDKIPDQLTEQYEAKLGGWDFRFQGMDVDIKPELKKDVGVRLYGDFLETSLQQSRPVGEEWTTTHGFRGLFRGEVNTYDHPELDLNLQAFKRWNGPIGDDYQANLDIGFGFRNRLHGEEWEKGMGAGISMRQEVEGGNFTVFNRDFRLYLDARQGYYRNLDTGASSASYSLMVGPKHDVDFKVFGRKGKVTLTVGPEIKGRFNDYRDEPFEVELKAKLKTKF